MNTEPATTVDEIKLPALSRNQLRRLKKKRREEMTRQEIAKIQQDSLVSQMIAEAIIWYHELPPERVQEIVRAFLGWKEAGGPKLEPRMDEVEIPQPKL